MILLNKPNNESSIPLKSSGFLSSSQPITLCVKRIFVLFLFSLFLLFLNTRDPVIERNERALTRKNPCQESLKTVRDVNSCPKDKSSWEERAKLKNCGDVPRKCFTTDFVYHCILDEYGRRLVELCAESVEVIGRRCAEFSSGGMFVQEHYENTCKTCPYVYNSSHSYLCKK
ncbi:uncharacterized protein LOC134239314 [Saccostrea cucullata]|uniref:uncharacterized protein LOC134239314 n=1 Tax=Saccostrea cuccullata TaxID=36930 RepID=UPI002ED2E693